uniref:Lactate/malate dehydrogenase C-terminal domain-containing protein n=2 Tax=Pseudocrenilabrinae TaxID=318546 RepID=A0A3Q4GJF8_NEOBR
LVKEGLKKTICTNYSEVFLSLPCIMGVNGSTRLAGVSLGQEEDSKLRNSVTSLSNLMAQLRI